jgi:hypothetical protein
MRLVHRAISANELPGTIERDRVLYKRSLREVTWRDFGEATVTYGFDSLYASPNDSFVQIPNKPL